MKAGDKWNWAMLVASLQLAGWAYVCLVVEINASLRSPHALGMAVGFGFAIGAMPLVGVATLIPAMLHRVWNADWTAMCGWLIGMGLVFPLILLNAALVILVGEMTGRWSMSQGQVALALSVIVLVCSIIRNLRGSKTREQMGAGSIPDKPGLQL
jgi:hypothetical protein